MTAAWCVTCLVNERVAIGTEPVRKAFAADDVAYLKGDWTRQDPAITAFLRQHGRDGVPLYVFFPGGGGQPEVLPQILTEGEVLGVLQASQAPPVRRISLPGVVPSWPVAKAPACAPPGRAVPPSFPPWRADSDAARRKPCPDARRASSGNRHAAAASVSPS